MTLILGLILVLVVLIIIEFYRKSLRLKQRDILNNIEKKDSEILVNQVKANITNIQEVQSEYPLLREGYLLFYFESIEPMEMKSLTMALKYYGVKYTDEKIFQKINYNDVIFSILPDSESQEFTSSNEGEIQSIVAVMNFKKLTSLEYDVKTCYELMMDVLEALSKSFNGTLMNEHKIRLTKKDKQNYLEAIVV